MNDEKDGVIDLLAARNAKAEKLAMEAHERGELFKFEIFSFDDHPQAPNGVGIISGEAPICLLVDKQKMQGLCMTTETARRLARELTAVADEWEQHQAEEPKQGA